MKFAEAIDKLAAGILRVLADLISSPRIEREFALCVDVFMAFALAVFPGVYGWIASVAFFLLRDAFSPRTYSPGKSTFSLRVVKSSDGSPASWRFTLVRNLLLLTPVLIVDVYYFIRFGWRMTDKWLGLEVIASQDASQNANEVDYDASDADDDQNPPNEE